jgi:hypothetical protein
VPLQNRVDPWGRLLATEARGTLMGNRGCLHDEHRRILRHHRGERWILCLLEFKGRQHTVMTPRHYTELFFLDEATGLAAGHRPCAECQRGRYRDFRDAWTRGNPELTSGGVAPNAAGLDGVLHRERLDSNGAKRVHPADFADLPDGAIVEGDREDEAFLVFRDALYAWSIAGYGPPRPRPRRGRARVLTPPSILGALATGYLPSVHASARPG